MGTVLRFRNYDYDLIDEVKNERVNVNTHPNVIRDMVAARNRNRKAGKVETIFGTKRFMSVATINRMRKADLDDWLFQRGFMPEAFRQQQEKREVLIEDLKGELNA